MKLNFCAVVLFVLTACGTSLPDAVPVSGDPGDLRALSGEWRGEYESRATGRTGSIVFRFTDDDVARGDVTMMPVPEPVEPSPREGATHIHAHTGATVIAIRQVNVSGARITGELEPYVDPDTRASVTTTFAGAVDGDVIEGSFTMIDAAHAAPLMGKWKVKRVR